jgi:hypothetical protein
VSFGGERFFLAAERGCQFARVAGSTNLLVFSTRPTNFAAHFMAKKSIRDIDVTGKRVFVRVDFNVPLDEKDGGWSSPTRRGSRRRCRRCAR